ncbi:hypothetical protein LY78DRAFT_244425 [Colletotrichum sublineola]|nr:hypothetical protein LY78DRAFT_244425 [Colletotrichum sublineola]
MTTATEPASRLQAIKHRPLRTGARHFAASREEHRGKWDRGKPSMLELRRKLSPSATSQSTSFFVFAQPAWGKLHKPQPLPLAVKRKTSVHSSDPKLPDLQPPNGVRKHGREEMGRRKKRNLKPIFLSMRAGSSLCLPPLSIVSTQFPARRKNPFPNVTREGGGGRWSRQQSAASHLATWKRGCAGYQDFRPARLMFRALQSASRDPVLDQDLQSCIPLAGATPIVIHCPSDYYSVPSTIP